MNTTSIQSTNAVLRLAYLVSQYPAVNHTFILREIRRLRSFGAEIHVASIRQADRPEEKLSEEERDEFRQTFLVIPAGLSGVVRANLKAIFSRPAAYFGGLLFSLRLGRLDPIKTFARLAYFIEAMIVGDWMMRKGLSHAHVHFSSTVGLILQRVFPITISITIHGPDEFNDPSGFHLEQKIKGSLFISAISNYAKSQLMRFSESEDWEKIEVVPLGIDPSVFAPHDFRSRPETFEIICVGRLSPVKAHNVLVAAIGRLVRERRNVRLRIVGEGPNRKSIEREIERLGLGRCVQLEGALNHDRVLDLYREADIFALPSFAEGVPVVLMEAMAMEIPCVATRIMGVPELIRDGLDGLLVDPADEMALANAIVKLMDDPELRRQLGAAGRRRVMEKYDLERNCELLAEVFMKRLGTSMSQPEESADDRLEESTNAVQVEIL